MITEAGDGPSNKTHIASSVRSADRAPRLGLEIGLVLALSLGRSAVYAVVALLAAWTAGPLSQHKPTLNPARSPREYLDLTYQLLALGFDLVPVLLAIYFLSAGRPLKEACRDLGLWGRWTWQDGAWGVGLAATVGIPGLGLFIAGQWLGLAADVAPATMASYWWTVPVLVLSALRNGLLEEIIVVGYLWDRLRALGWSTWTCVLTSCALRGSYHLYQGPAMFVGNAVMGVMFWWVYRRTGRLMPLVIAHTLLDVVAFVGYQYVNTDWLRIGR